MTFGNWFSVSTRDTAASKEDETAPTAPLIADATTVPVATLSADRPPVKEAVKAFEDAEPAFDTLPSTWERKPAPIFGRIVTYPTATSVPLAIYHPPAGVSARRAMP